MTGLNFIKFVREVKIEAKRVVWPPMKETAMVSMLVLAAVAIAGILLFFADGLMHKLVQYLLEF